MNGGHLSKSQKEWTPARKKSFIVSVLRGGSRRWPPKYETLNESKTEKKVNTLTGRIAQHFRCASCGGEFPAKQVNVNHKVPVVDPEIGFTTWDDFIERLFCDKSLLEVLCVPCHKEVTEIENKARKNVNSRKT